MAVCRAGIRSRAHRAEAAGAGRYEARRSAVERARVRRSGRRDSWPRKQPPPGGGGWGATGWRAGRRAGRIRLAGREGAANSRSAVGQA
ncbi:hypothetical protein F01_460476 [Burkholderia cenocepacia]|nr:hypothetical protein F01_460476 [Burkholderia cenocepacia]